MSWINETSNTSRNHYRVIHQRESIKIKQEKELQNNKIVVKVPPELRLKGRGLGKVDNLMMGKQALNRHGADKAQKEKNKNLRLIPLELRLTREKNATKGQVTMSQSMNMMAGSVFMPMMTAN